MRIATWSGPRNISTAMMYAFGNRSDFAAWDEPFYAAYLEATGIDHPMREDVLAANESDPQRVAERCLGPIPGGRRHFYMKHMPFHMEPGFPLDWAESCVNIHLIRHPARVVASYVAKRDNPVMRDIGFKEQLAMFERFPGPVVDSADILRNPEAALRGLCDAIRLDFDPSMLSWPAGPKPFDGAWAPHWYGSAHQSTGFAGSEASLPELEGEARKLTAQALPFYERLAAEALQF